MTRSRKILRVVKAATDLPNPQEVATVALLKEENGRLRRKLLTKGAAGELIVQAVEACFSDYRAPNVHTPRKSAKSGEAEEAVLHVSDVQYGKITASYDSTVATE